MKRHLIILVVVLGCGLHGWSEVQRYRIYLDADFTGARASSRAIECGIRTALDMVDYQIGGKPVDLVRVNHRGNSRRSRENLKAIGLDAGALAVFCGLHSPPVLANLDIIHENQLLYLDPWAAAAPITRYSMDTNWVFRLSLDDSKVGSYLVEYAVDKLGLKRPMLVLEETSWGKSNEYNIKKALSARGVTPAGVQWFNWNLDSLGARMRLRRLFEDGADGILLVANAPEGIIYVKEMAGFPANRQIPIISHWGITGGTFAEQVGVDVLSKVDLCFVQPDLSVLFHPTSFAKAVFDRAHQLFGDEWSVPAVGPSPAGFLHGHDLTRLLIAAGNQEHLSGNLVQDKEALRKALDHLEEPIEGLLKVYEKPFSSMANGGQDAHEALQVTDYRIARFQVDGAIILEEADHD